MRDLIKLKSLYETDYFKNETQYSRKRIFDEKNLRIAEYFGQRKVPFPICGLALSCSRMTPLRFIKDGHFSCSFCDI